MDYEDKFGDDTVTAIVAEGELCFSCRTHGGFTRFEKPALEVRRICRTKSGLTASGIIRARRCPVCGTALNAINNVVPIELDGMICSCGGNDFRFAISSLKKTRAEWIFDLDVICRACEKTKFHEKLLDFFKLKRLKIGATGVDVQLK